MYTGICGQAHPQYDGVYDVDDSVTALIRTEGRSLP